MASCSSSPFVVKNTTMEQNCTNLCYCCPDDTQQFAVRPGRRGRWPFALDDVLYLALVNGKTVFSVQADEKVEKGHISLNPDQCKSLDVSLGDTILLKLFVPPFNGFDVAKLRIMVELLPESSTPTQMIMASSLGREFRKTFHHQVVTEYQRVTFTYKGSSYACSVVEVSLSFHENEKSESPTPKQGMIRNLTKVIVEVPESLVMNK